MEDIPQEPPSERSERIETSRDSVATMPHAARIFTAQPSALWRTSPWHFGQSLAGNINILTVLIGFPLILASVLTRRLMYFGIFLLLVGIMLLYYANVEYMARVRREEWNERASKLASQRTQLLKRERMRARNDDGKTLTLTEEQINELVDARVREMAEQQNIAERVHGQTVGKRYVPNPLQLRTARRYVAGLSEDASTDMLPTPGNSSYGERLYGHVARSSCSGPGGACSMTGSRSAEADEIDEDGCYTCYLQPNDGGSIKMKIPMRNGSGGGSDSATSYQTAAQNHGGDEHGSPQAQLAGMSGMSRQSVTNNSFFQFGVANDAGLQNNMAVSNSGSGNSGSSGSGSSGGDDDDDGDDMGPPVSTGQGSSQQVVAPRKGIQFAIFDVDNVQAGTPYNFVSEHTAAKQTLAQQQQQQQRQRRQNPLEMGGLAMPPTGAMGVIRTVGPGGLPDNGPSPYPRAGPSVYGTEFPGVYNETGQYSRAMPLYDATVPSDGDALPLPYSDEYFTGSRLMAMQGAMRRDGNQTMLQPEQLRTNCQRTMSSNLTVPRGLTPYERMLAQGYQNNAMEMNELVLREAEISQKEMFAMGPTAEDYAGMGPPTNYSQYTAPNDTRSGQYWDMSADSGCPP